MDGEEEDPSAASGSGSGETGSTRLEVVLQRSSGELLSKQRRCSVEGRRRLTSRGGAAGLASDGRRAGKEEDPAPARRGWPAAVDEQGRRRRAGSQAGRRMT